MIVENIISQCIESMVSLEVEGENLKLSGEVKSLDKALIQQIKDNKSALVAWLKEQQTIENKRQNESIDRVERDGRGYPATPGQRMLWFIDNLDDGSAQYNSASALRVAKIIDPALVTKTADYILERHESLRCRFLMGENGLKQHIQQNVTSQINQHHVNPANAEEEHELVNQYVNDEAKKAFDLAADSMLRVSLMYVGNTHTVIIFTMHHIASDGWSAGILFKEFCHVLNAYGKGQEAELAPLPLQFVDYSTWLDKSLTQGYFDDSLTYWEKQLEAAPRVHNLPMDFPRGAKQTSRGDGVAMHLDKSLIDSLEEYAKQNNATLYMVLETAYALLLGRWSNEADIVIGTAVSGREQDSWLAEQIGYYSNVIALRTQLPQATSFTELLAANRSNVLNGLANQSVPFESVLERIRVAYEPSHSPLFQISFTLEHQHDVDASSVASDINSIELAVTDSLTDLSLFVHPGKNGWGVLWRFNSDLFLKETIENISQSYRELLASISSQPDQDIYSLNILSQSQQAQIGHWSKGPEKEVSGNLISHFSSLSQTSGNNIAVIDGDRSITYAQLEDESNRLSNFLIGRELQLGEVVAVSCSRSIELVLAAVAIMKAGGVYLPVDPTLPSARIRKIIDATGARLMLTQKDKLAAMPMDMVSAVPLDEEFRERLFGSFDSTSFDGSRIQSSGTAYMIFTSGSSGEPKGVCISHRALINFIDWHVNQFDINSQANLSLLAGIGFDASVWELAGGLVSGATLVCVNEKTMSDPMLLVDCLQKNEVSHAYIPTALVHVMDEMDILVKSGVKYIHTGGDKLSALKSDLKNIKVINHYGPTEGTVYVSSAEVSKKDVGMPSIGCPIQNTQLYVVNESDELQPPGAIGELCIAGSNLMSGYHGREETGLIKVNLLGTEVELYKTGDNVRYKKNGELEYCYRAGSQIKLNGLRIDFSEITSQLTNINWITDAWVKLQGKDNDNYLVAYVTATQDIDEEKIKSLLAENLPGYMVPNAYVQMEILPVNASGKVDNSKLPEFEFSHIHEYQAPENDVEEKIQAIWQDVFNSSEISVKANFFDLGGTSIKVISLVNKINASFTCNLTVPDAIKRTTIRMQADYINQLLQLEAKQQELMATDDVNVMEW